MKPREWPTSQSKTSPAFERQTYTQWAGSRDKNLLGLRPRGAFFLDIPFYRTSKALWKLGWFLRDFLYDSELLGREEVDEKALSGLRGVVKISHATVNGTSLLNLDGFAPASQWEELSSSTTPKASNSEVA